MRALQGACLALLLAQASVLLLQPAHTATTQASGSHGIAERHQLTRAEQLTAVQRLRDALLQDGAEIHAGVREAGPSAGLELFAQSDIKAGDTIMAVPTDAGFRAVAAHGVMDFLLDFLLDFHSPDSPRRLLWDTTPPEVRHLLNFPAEYVHLLQHDGLQEWIGRGLHADLALFQRMHAERLAAAGISYGDIVHGMGLIGTRMFGRAHPADASLTLFYAIPLLDMANHNNGCPHFNEFGPCGWDDSRECVYFTAGAAVAAGDEVCFWYGHLQPDRALLEYGFLPAVPAAPTTRKQAARRNRAVAAAAAAATAAAGANATAAAAAAPQQNKQRRRPGAGAKQAEAQLPALPLFGIDRHDFDMANPLPKLEAEQQPFIGTMAHIDQRISELQQLAQRLADGDSLAAAQAPAPSDAGGSFLAQLQAWRQQRQAAVAGEVTRLQRVKTNTQIRQALMAASRRRA